MGKAYGLAGLRVGYAVGRARLVTGFRAASTPFGVNALAQVAALESLRNRSALLERVDQLVQERDRVVGALRKQGWAIPDPQGNFVWFGVGERAGVRVSIGDPGANDVVIDIAGELRARF